MCTVIHHVAAISGNLQRTVSFYHRILGLSFHRKISLFDGPQVCHFYWGLDIDSFLTFYHCPGLQRGRAGDHTIGSLSFSLDSHAMPYWIKRLNYYCIRFVVEEGTESMTLEFPDPDGLLL